MAEAAQQRLLAYDRVGDQHYEAASAFIKSMRGNDPDAALYWCASMIAAGEDPTFIARRIVIAASEDVGNADPRALQIAVAAMQATEMIGLPEAQYALAQAAAYVASAPKSNRAGGAYFAALAEVEEHGRLPVPLHLRPSTHRRLAREQGYGKGYLYPHDYESPTSSSSTCPTRWSGASSTSRATRGWRSRSGSGSSACGGNAWRNGSPQALLARPASCSSSGARAARGACSIGWADFAVLDREHDSVVDVLERPRPSASRFDPTSRSPRPLVRPDTREPEVVEAAQDVEVVAGREREQQRSRDR